MKQLALLLVLFTILFIEISAQDVCLDSTTIINQTEKNWGIGWHPIIGYDDDVKLTLGAGCVIYFEPKDKNQDLDEIEISSTYNWAKQSDLILNFSKYFHDNICSIEGEFGYKNYPDDYLENDYNAVYIPFEIGALFKIKEKIYIGPYYKFNYSNIHFIEKELDSKILGSGKTLLSGFGGKIIYKNLPNGQIYLRKGSLFELAATYNSSIFLSSENFLRINADFRHYRTLFNSCVLAFQCSAKTSLGDIPFTSEATLENKSILRGAENRQGKHFIATQTEYRFPIAWRLGGVVFAGIGDVQNKIYKLGSNFCFAAGFGPRITLNKHKNITLRFDFAMNDKGDKSIYIKIKEAF